MAEENKPGQQTSSATADAQNKFVVVLEDQELERHGGNPASGT